ncbi:MAG: hypothetical protein GY711_31855 [bacterium]|nr:hypothetical protein [bacterium]
MTPARSDSARLVRLRPQDPFDLIRLLARSQSDPRKAVAELVQNSLDAGARRIEIVWFNEKGRRALRIWDDGSGVFPELEREDALRQIARTIGHSHKRDLSPAERREHLVLGQYGIGLIGFWSVGEVLEMKSRVDGGGARVLRLREDKAQGEVFASRARLLDEPPTFTEITIRAVHEGAVNKVRPPRLQAYLAGELRGQLLQHGAQVRIRDRVARGRARKEFVVEPRPYLGRPLDAWRELDIPGFESARVELYLVAPDEDRRGVVSLACGGTTVLDDITEIDGKDAPRQPWSGGRLEGVIDFPELHVAPASRRGFAHDEPVAAFLAALEVLERELHALLEEEAQRRATQRQEHVAREIRRAFRSVATDLPDYDFFGVSGATDGPGRDASAGSGSAEEGAPIAAAHDDADLDADPEPQDSAAVRPRDADLLFPPGALARLELSPRAVRAAPLATRSLRARTLDADGRPCAGDVQLTWRLEGAGELLEEGARARYHAPDTGGGELAPTRILVRAEQGDVRLEASASVTLVRPDPTARLQGIPEPHPVSDPAQPWRSRVQDGRWEYNEAHRDYLAVADVEARRLRYLIHLFAKEVVLRNFGRPGDAENLERMVEVLTRLDRR